MEEGKDKTQNSEPDFYRPQGQSSKELGRRLELIQKVSIELKTHPF
jgi:hypothetical protein